MRTLRVDAIDAFMRMSGCTAGPASMVYLSYGEYAFTAFLFAATCASVARAQDVDLSMQLYGVLCLLIESFLLLCVPIRLYQCAEFRDMCDRAADAGGPPAPYRAAIGMITRYHLVASNCFVLVSGLYAFAADGVRAGDPFTFPFMDVLPSRTDGLSAAYLCKYAVYALPVYIAHLEICFLNVTFVHSAGVLRRYFDILTGLVDDAMADGDVLKLDVAVRHHQRLLEYFKIMKRVYTKPVLLTTAFCSIYLGLVTCFTIQSIQGYVHEIIIGICITSGMAALITQIIYCTYANDILNLHDKVLLMFDNRSYFVNKQFKKHSMLMMIRTSIPLDFKIGYIFSINLNLLLRIIKFSYSFLNVLLASTEH